MRNGHGTPRWLASRISARGVDIALCVALLSAAWTLPALGLWQHAQERERMESGIYYTPRLPAQAYLDASTSP